ncbi:sulfite exporter TauE/SafE family protein [Amaricoccus macauensis]|uniref:sulfite exporter TauE/SafE family protein n=1 Tax=Amaricoccus macauensis TaxID=57001 RepID=UPI003C7CA710
MEDILVLSVATLAAGFLRGVTGFGFALAAVPLYSLSVPPVYAVVMAQMLQIAAGPLDIYHNHKKVDRRALALLCGGALLFTPLGAFLATRLPADVMRLTIAIAVLLGLVALVAKVRIREGKGPAMTAGAMAGLLGGLAAMPGPPAVAYFLGRGADKTESRATLLLFFAFTSVIALISIALGSDAVTFKVFLSAVASYPALLLGTYLGTLLFQRLGDGHYRSASMGVLLVSGLMAGAKGLVGLI